MNKNRKTVKKYEVLYMLWNAMDGKELQIEMIVNDLYLFQDYGIHKYEFPDYTLFYLCDRDDDDDIEDAWMEYLETPEEIYSASHHFRISEETANILLNEGFRIKGFHQCEENENE